MQIPSLNYKTRNFLSERQLEHVPSLVSRSLVLVRTYPWSSGAGNCGGSVHAVTDYLSN